MNELATTDPSKVRRFRRREIDVRVAVINKAQVRFAEALEISEGGLLFRTAEKYPVGSWIEICLFIPGDKFISVRADVIYLVDDDGESRKVGIKFHDPEAALQLAIRHFVDKS